MSPEEKQKKITQTTVGINDHNSAYDKYSLQVYNYVRGLTVW